jgi:hypothetical protein
MNKFFLNTETSEAGLQQLHPRLPERYGFPKKSKIINLQIFLKHSEK